MSELTRQGCSDVGRPPSAACHARTDLTINGDQYRLTCELGDTLLTVLRRLGCSASASGREPASPAQQPCCSTAGSCPPTSCSPARLAATR